MENLLTPDKGLMIWTVVTFLLLVWVLKKVAWKPLLQALKEREDSIRHAIDDAQAAKQTAEQLKARYEQELAQGQEKAQAILAQSEKDAQKVRERILKEAEEESKRLSALTHRQLEEEKAKLIRELRKEVAGLSIMAAEKLVRRSINDKVQEEILQEFFDELDHSKELH